ncbi:MAG TPA: hypothetical protein VLB73_01060 [Patescibacteria group bacterium]|nr:hypothetical protein [Patescibacteria group bacterium]
MKELHEGKVALSVGIFLGVWHAMWSLLILVGVAQPLLDFIFWAHMLSTPFRVTGFSLTQAIVLVLVTFAVGYIGGWVFAKVWNMMRK